MKRNRFILLLLLLIGGLYTTTGKSGTRQLQTATPVTNQCQHTAGTIVSGTAGTTGTDGTEPVRTASLSEKLVGAVDTFARLVMVL